MGSNGGWLTAGAAADVTWRKGMRDEKDLRQSPDLSSSFLV